ncbi:MAG: methyltransferase [Candidatus Riflebacteria bacterium]|nr:methyltransferase [Candidatus Riflebacteria bacterium]
MPNSRKIISSMLREGERIDELSVPPWKIIQKTDGTAFSVDTVLLVDFAEVEDENLKIADLGSGSGIISFLIREKFKNPELTGFEILPEMHELAERNLLLNDSPSGINFRCFDVCKIVQEYKAESFDLVLSNPPYYKIGRGKISPSKNRAHARHEVSGKLGDFVSASSHLVKSAGRIIFILPAERCTEAIELFSKKSVVCCRQRFVRPFESVQPNLVLLEFRKSDVAIDFQKLPDLIIRDRNRSFTKEMTKIYED